MDNNQAEEVKNQGGCPTKCTDEFLAVAEEVLNSDINAIISTDNELRLAINNKLPIGKGICKATFKNWKAGKLDEQGEKFLALYEKALYQQKINLFSKLREDNQWQRYAWILERKFDEWNIRNKQEIDGSMQHTHTHFIESIILKASNPNKPE